MTEMVHFNIYLFLREHSSAIINLTSECFCSYLKSLFKFRKGQQKGNDNRPEEPDWRDFAKQQQLLSAAMVTDRPVLKLIYLHRC